MGPDCYLSSPDPPQTPMLHLLLRTSPEAFVAGARELAERGLWTWPRSMVTGDPEVQRVELSVGDSAPSLSVADAIHTPYPDRGVGRTSSSATLPRACSGLR